MLAQVLAIIVERRGVIILGAIESSMIKLITLIKLISGLYNNAKGHEH